MIGVPTNLSSRTCGHATLRIQDFLLALLLWIGGYFGTRTQSPDCKTGVLSFELKTHKPHPVGVERIYGLRSQCFLPLGDTCGVEGTRTLNPLRARQVH